MSALFQSTDSSNYVNKPTARLVNPDVAIIDLGRNNTWSELILNTGQISKTLLQRNISSAVQSLSNVQFSVGTLRQVDPDVIPLKGLYCCEGGWFQIRHHRTQVRGRSRQYCHGLIHLPAFTLPVRAF